MASRSDKAPAPHQPADARVASNGPPLRLRIDADVHVQARRVPKAVVEALRRQLRRHDIERLLRYAGRSQGDGQLLRSEQGEYHLPQAMLGQLLDICRRNGITCELEDERVRSSCPRLRSTIELNDAQATGLRQLLLRDCGILIAGDRDRIALAAELIARREQRTLLLTRQASLDALHAALAEAFAVGAPDLAPLRSASERSRLVIASYERVLDSAALGRDGAYGLIVFDDLVEVDPITLVRTLRLARARYLLGLADEAARSDGLHAPLYFALGGIVAQLVTPGEVRVAKLAYRRRVSHFGFQYKGREHYQALLATLAADAERNALIAADVAAEVRAGNPCLVLSERRDHLEAISQLLPEPIARASDAITSAVRPGDRNAISARFSRGELEVVLATSQIASELPSLQHARRLFITFPFSYSRKLERIIEQLMGPEEGKSEVMVFDYDDAQLPPLHRACEKRSKIIGRLQRVAERAYADWAQMKLEL